MLVVILFVLLAFFNSRCNILRFSLSVRVSLKSKIDKLRGSRWNHARQRLVLQSRTLRE